MWISNARHPQTWTQIIPPRDTLRVRCSVFRFDKFCIHRLQKRSSAFIITIRFRSYLWRKRKRVSPFLFSMTSHIWSIHVQTPNLYEIYPIIERKLLDRFYHTSWSFTSPKRQAKWSMMDRRLLKLIFSKTLLAYRFYRTCLEHFKRSIRKRPLTCISKLTEQQRYLWT